MMLSRQDLLAKSMRWTAQKLQHLQEKLKAAEKLSDKQDRLIGTQAETMLHLSQARLAPPDAIDEYLDQEAPHS